MESSNNEKRPWYTGETSWPFVYVKESERDEDMYKAAIDYAIMRHRQRTDRIKKITDMKNSYNGTTSASDTEKLNSLYGKEFHAQYKDYNLSRRKADQLAGEFIDAPINGTLYAVNQMALQEKRDVQDVINGMKLFKKEIGTLRKEQLADPYDGFVPPDEKPNENMSSFQRMSGRTKNEYIMQKFIDEQIKIKNIKDNFYYNLLDAIFANECFGKVELDATGKAYYRNIDCRNMLFEEVDGDTMLQKTPYLGEERWMFVNEIFEEWPELLENETLARRIKSLEGSKTNSDSPVDSQMYYMDPAGGLMVKTYTIELYCYDTTYFKTHAGKPDDFTIMSSSYVESKKRSRQIKNDVKNNRYQLLSKVKKTLCGVTRIAEDIYIIHGKIPYTIGSFENPYETEYNYCGMTFGTQNGKRTSIFEALEDIKFEYNVARMIINRELFKSKGLAMAYDRQYLPKVSGVTMTMNEVITKIINDGIIDYNGATDANMSVDLQKVTTHLEVRDLGMSKMVPQVLQIAFDCERIADLISGVNKERQGNTPASQTATTAGNNMMQSRAVTASIFYFFNRFTAEVFRKLVERRKVGIAYIELAEDDAESIVGHEGVGYLKATQDIAKYDYAYYMSDGRKEMQIRQTIREYIPNALQSGELRPQDVVMMELQDTLSEVYTTLENGWNTMKKMAAEQEDKKLEAMAQGEERKIQMAKENREDMQAHEAALEALKGSVKVGAASQQAMNDYVINAQQQKADEKMMAEQQQMQ